MKKKPSTATRTGSSNRALRSTTAPSRNAHRDDDLYFCAHAVHKTAKKLAGALKLGSNPLGEFDAYPVLLLYRHAVELFLKAIVLGEGGNFLATKPDHISVGKTRSVSWLAQFVAQIITTLKWEDQFRCKALKVVPGSKRSSWR